ncbi:hypothetical protein BSU04_14650 [Caballeronia sordidicola]|uniref:Uncharacterized protein n=1 Tax=Caballeronia sordidicola TaxID=196367 RepID=A0A226X346_CABSO|nr:hypothetical protein BSU04_14650 [Caballeronia sordidicola]
MVSLRRTTASMTLNRSSSRIDIVILSVAAIVASGAVGIDAG